MALSQAKVVMVVCSSFVLITFLIVQQSGILRMKPKVRDNNFTT